MEFIHQYSTLLGAVSLTSQMDSFFWLVAAASQRKSGVRGGVACVSQLKNVRGINIE